MEMVIAALELSEYTLSQYQEGKVNKQLKDFICLQLSLLTLYNENVQRIMLQFLVRFKSKTFINKESPNVNTPEMSVSYQISTTVSEYYLTLEGIGKHLN